MTDKRAYFRVDVGYLANPKIAVLVEENPRAVLLHLQCIAYATQHATDGLVPMRLAMRQACAEQCDLDLLLHYGLLDAVSSTTVLVHDYLEHQRSSNEVKTASDKAKAAALARWASAPSIAPSIAPSMPDALPTAMPREKERETKERCASAGAPARFDEFWSIYPEKKGKQTAIKAWKNAVKVADPDVIIAGARRYARWLGEQREKDATTKAKYPEGWLNAGRWEDELDAPEQPPEQRGSFTAPPLPDGAPRTMFVPWNRAHRDAWLAGKPGPTDWHEIQVAS